ncbi:hypothetical protein DFJ74DRAFT_766688 [Hyaloraphidium curvatum]|nr:hypothetical protein DFJ74DRAFT_766688 [Hyaloraphidium curvatum]
MVSQDCHITLSVFGVVAVMIGGLLYGLVPPTNGAARGVGLTLLVLGSGVTAVYLLACLCGGCGDGKGEGKAAEEGRAGAGEGAKIRKGQVLGAAEIGLNVGTLVQALA